MITRRILINVGVFGGLFALLMWYGVSQLIMQPTGGRTVTFDFVDGAGLQPRDDVTMQRRRCGPGEGSPAARDICDRGRHGRDHAAQPHR